MAYIALALLLVTHVLPWMKRSKLETSPSKILFLFSAITTIPYVGIISFDPDLSSARYLVVADFGENLVKFCLIYSLGLLGFLIGSKFGHSSGMGGLIAYPMRKTEKSRVACVVVTYISCFVVVFLTFIKLEQVGGVAELWANIALRSEALAGTGFLDAFIYPFGYLAVVFAVYTASSGRKYSIVSAVFIFLLVAVCFSVFGGRKNTLYLIVFAVLAAKVYNKNISFISPSFILLYAAGAAFFFYVLVFRLEAQDNTTSSLNMVDVVANLSYADTYLFITDYFSRNPFWLGSIFGDIPLRIFSLEPSSLLPPIDDGVYIRTLAEGLNARPPTPFNAMYPSSWPPESYGSGYANFGVVGVFLFFLIKGAVCGVIGKWAKLNGYGPFALVLLFSAILGFHISNLRIIQFVVLVVGMLFISVVLNQIGRVRMRR
jgi:hypothetical protein